MLWHNYTTESNEEESASLVYERELKDGKNVKKSNVLSIT